ncbi:hypothetical protein JTE90_009464 [Oedothorax gibbosus]|uniref:Uncharacterized protein n=1 Tax=Oedothorax gibbosus TaxID=931172 RepID=A0AAV6VSY4_9ARAC|nr:hypothetical protein JTE90_009464 [Oedothorax gibbosus]
MMIFFHLSCWMNSYKDRLDNNNQTNVMVGNFLLSVNTETLEVLEYIDTSFNDSSSNSTKVELHPGSSIEAIFLVAATSSCEQCVITTLTNRLIIDHATDALLAVDIPSQNNTNNF